MVGLDWVWPDVVGLDCVVWPEDCPDCPDCPDIPPLDDGWARPWATLNERAAAAAVARSA